MTEKESFKKAMKERVAKALRDGPVNHAAAINVGKSNSHTSVSTRQTVTQRDGKTEVTEVREERRES